MEKGYIHLYTGNGQGKTTAAFGMALRAVMSGRTVFVGQFVKGMVYNEARCAEFLPGIVIKQFGSDCFIHRRPEEKDVELARAGLNEVADVLHSGDFDVVILDELTIAIYYHLVSEEKVLEVIKDRDPRVEVIITGRYAQQSLIDIADLVSEITEVKHYYQKGVLSRDGFDH